MPGLPPSLVSLFVRPVFSLAVLGMVALPTLAQGADGGSSLVLVGRSIIQDQGSWQVDYRLRHEGAKPLTVNSDAVRARVEGWVSNSRVASHAVPRWSSLVIAGPGGPSATDLIASGDESLRCRERATLRIGTGDFSEPADEPPARPGARDRGGNGVSVTAANTPAPTLTIAPGALVRVRLRLDHMHFLYGDYDPLLGHRAIELHLGEATFRDPAVPMDREQYLAQPKVAWPAPPEERRDTHIFLSAPDSLHLEAHIPGNHNYRFTDRPVRYATPMRLRFWYLVAAGTEGECRARISQYKDTPTAWKILTEGAQEERLTQVGRWVKVERVFRTEPEATTLALEFQIAGAEVGEMWIDDVSLEPLGAASADP